MDLLEILIDKLLIYLPPDIPFLSTLIQQPEGRYIVFGLALVIVLLVVWTLLASLQMFFFIPRRQANNERTPPIELTKNVETEGDASSEMTDGFSFFRKERGAEVGDHDENPLLVAIEQEMLAVRSLYTSGQILKDVYVSETRRLYAKAQTVKNTHSE
jgi:hypothetical protein